MRILVSCTATLALFLPLQAQQPTVSYPRLGRQGVAVAPDTTSATQSGRWEFTLAPYGLAPTMSGTTAVGRLPPVDVEASASDIFSHLQGGLMLYFQVAKGPWSFATDGIYMHLKQDIASTGGRLSGSASVQQGALEGFFLRQVVRTLELGIGGLGNHLRVDLEATLATPPGGKQRASSKSEMWGTPVAAARWTPFNWERWHLVLFSDIGTLGSDNWTWQVMPSVGYRFSRTFELAAQYRAIGITYATGSDQDYFQYDMKLFGPQIGLAFHF
jgi:hypothetical protein